MAWGAFQTIALILIVAAGAGLLVEAGWIPWIVPVTLLVVGLIVAGIAAYRAR
jgi:hypothetical protein